MTDTVISPTLTFSQPFTHAEKQLLTPEAIDFLHSLVVRFAPERERLLKARQQRYDQGALPDFNSETASIGQSDWRARPDQPHLLNLARRQRSRVP
ncbi:malate synthase A [Plautia stali symbiont]|nr:malate synthase A [Plautia stali symbiont]